MRGRATITLGGDHAVGWSDHGVAWTVVAGPAEKASGPAAAALVPFPLGMAYDSDPSFRVLHALRIKGFAKVDVLSDLSAVEPDEVEQRLADFQTGEIALFREARALWQLTPKGREVHAEQLASEVEAIRPLVEPHYPAFLELNEAFKELCGDWQLRAGAPNDHTDAAHDEAVIGRLLEIDSEAQPVVIAVGTEVTRLSPYAPRLSSTAQRVAGGDHQLFTGVMCGSYHDVWMELHEDLILTLGIDRAKEGSF
jgi:hypothetical protein